MTVYNHCKMANIFDRNDRSKWPLFMGFMKTVILVMIFLLNGHFGIRYGFYNKLTVIFVLN